jgi:hypothetical protein
MTNSMYPFGDGTSTEPLDDGDEYGIYVDPQQEAAEPRTVYGTSDVPNFASLLPSAGDPAFYTDGQNNDEFYTYDTDVPRETLDSSQPEYAPTQVDPDESAPSVWDQEDGAG